MKIGIDISQTAYQKTGVANYLSVLVEHMLKIDQKNTYILFFSSLRGTMPEEIRKLAISHANVQIKTFPFPPTVLDMVWNTLHVFPIEWLIGEVDVFIASDWTQPPTNHAKSLSILYDLIVYKAPEETDAKIVQTQKRRLEWVKKECEKILCISQATKHDAKELLGIDDTRLIVTYPGV